jgi:hypothetical protein
MDENSTYLRDTDFMVHVYRDPTIDKRLYINSYVWASVHDHLFFYKTYYHIMKHYGFEPSVQSLWNHTTMIFPHEYTLFVNDMIRRNIELSLPETELNGVCSYVFTYFQSRTMVPKRDELVKASESFNEKMLNSIVDKWVSWMKRITKTDPLEKIALDACMDIIFLDTKTLSLDNDEDKYVSYIKRKFEKQLERPEHKLFTLLRIMNSISIPVRTNDIIERYIS